MNLRELLRGVTPHGDLPDLEIAEVRDDSRAVGRGDLFVALRGQTVDGHRYLAAAAERGAAAAVVEDASGAPAGLPLVVVDNSALALAHAAANRYGRPADALTLVGITGTNGKTTTAFLAERLARAVAGGVPGVIGTVTYRWPGVARDAPFTTPTPLQLHATLAEMRAAGCTHVCMEASSHALALDRLGGLRFAVSAFTNLTQDHLDFHRTMEAYRDAKARLFSELTDGTAVIFVDREHGEEMARAARGRALLRASTRTDGAADIRLARPAAHTVDGIEAELVTPKGPLHLRSPLIGAFNLENLVVAVGIGLGLGLSPAAIGDALADFPGAPGRLERVVVPGGAPFGVFVDYAHTPDALERVMAALRPLTVGRLLVVFGCGGDRDRTKRPLMGRAVARDADLAIVTSDNPRTEEPGAILDMILDGVRQEPSPALSPDPARLAGAGRGHVAVVDRRQAIGLAIAAARPGDVVLIAGKGHEDYQILGKTKHPFDDRHEARIAIEKLALSTDSPQS